MMKTKKSIALMALLLMMGAMVVPFVGAEECIDDPFTYDPHFYSDTIAPGGSKSVDVTLGLSGGGVTYPITTTGWDSVQNLPTDWEVTYSSADYVWSSETSTVMVTLSVNVPSSASPGDYTFTAKLLAGQDSRTSGGGPRTVSAGGGAQFTITVETSSPSDTTPPTTSISLSGTAGNNDWYISNVDVTLSATDNEGGSGVKEIHYILNSGSEVPSIINPTTFTITNEGTNTLSYWAVDNEGNTETAHSATIKIDKTAPIITITSPVGIYILNQPVTADYGASDATSGVDTCSGPVPDGESIDTSAAALGPHMFTVTATDLAGNTRTLTALYCVQYSTTYGHRILQPLEQVNAPTDLTKAYKFGSTLPVKFQLCDYYGNPVGPSNPLPTIAVSKVSSATDPGDPATALDSGSSNDNGNTFRYDPVAQQYIFNLSTKSLSIGTFRITVPLNDGSTIVTYFQLKK
jgi:hypothetical protein